MTGERIGPYEIERRLGTGGMAEVFLARKRLGTAFKQVVVKRMLAELIEDERFVEMFLREAGILAQLSHPNVVQIFDLGQTDAGEPYIAMEYLDGLSVHELAVRSWRARLALPTELVLRVVLEAARGLDYVHRQRGPRGEELKIVHRDVAPDNIFFLRDGIVKLVDFGIARAATTKLLTTKGELKGKVPFMAPELLEDVEVDGRADLWSLGVSAYWLLAGRRPFRGRNEVDVMRQILRDEPPRLRSINADAPAWLEELLVRLLEKNRDKRLQSGAAIEEIIVANAGARLDRNTDVTFVRDVIDVPASDLDDVTNPIPAQRRPSSVFTARGLVEEAKRMAPVPPTIEVPAPVTLPASPPAVSMGSFMSPPPTIDPEEVSSVIDGRTVERPTFVPPEDEPRPMTAPRAPRPVSVNDTHADQDDEGDEGEEDDEDDLFGADTEPAPFQGETQQVVFAGDTEVKPFVPPPGFADHDDDFAEPLVTPTTVERPKGLKKAPKPLALNPLPKAMNVEMPTEEPGDLDDNTQRLTESQIGIRRGRDDE